MKMPLATEPAPSRPGAARGLAAIVLAVLACGALVRAAMTSGLRPSFFWDSASYVDYARQWKATGRLPEGSERTPGYPLFLRGAGRPFFTPRGVVRWQKALGVAGAGLVVLLVWAMTKRKAAAIAAGAASVLFLDLLFMELVIYTETLAAAIILGAVTCLSLALILRERAAVGVALTGFVLAGLAPTIRPVFVATVPVFGVALVVLHRRRRLRTGAAVLAGGLLLVPTFGLAASPRVRKGLSEARHANLLNYVGFPAIYRRLPDAPVRRALVRAGRGHSGGFVPWYESIGPLMSIERKRMGIALTPREVADRVGRRALAEAPLGYALVWLGTARHFFFDFEFAMGYYASTADFETARPQLSGARAAAASGLKPYLVVLVPILSLAALIGPPVVLFLRLARRRRPPPPLPVFLAWGVILAVALPTITLESMPGSGRYRLPVQLLILAIAVWTALVVVDAARAIGWRGVRLSLSGAAG